MLILSRSALAPPGNNGHGNNPDDTITLIGVARDFEPDHPDFDVVPPEGYGHYMWNVATAMNAEGRPAYVGGGYKVFSQAHDAQGPPSRTTPTPAASRQRRPSTSGSVTFPASTCPRW
jgi:hypothetical protein